VSGQLPAQPNETRSVQQSAQGTNADGDTSYTRSTNDATVAPKTAGRDQDVQQQPGHYRRWQGQWWYWMPGTPGQWYVHNGVAWTPYRPGMTLRDLHEASVRDLSKDELALYAFTGEKGIPQRPESLNPTQNDTPQLGVAAGTGLNGTSGGGIIGGRQTGRTTQQLMNRYGAVNGVGSGLQSPYQIGGLPGGASNALSNRGGAATNGPNTNLNSSQSQFSQLAGQGAISTVAPGLNTGGTQPPGSPGSPALSNGGQIGSGGAAVGSLGGSGTSSGAIGASSAAGAGLSGVSGATGGGTGAAAGSAGAGGPGGGGAAGAGGGAAGGGH
jgi:hypothetical protein